MDGARGEVIARGGSVDELEPLALADEHDRVLAGVVAAAQRLDADRRRGPRTDLASALEHQSAGLRSPFRWSSLAFSIVFARLWLAATLGDRLGESQRGAAGRIALGRVVQLDDLRIERGAEPLRRRAHQPDERVHRQREICRAHDRDPRTQCVERVRVGPREPGRTGDVGDACVGARARRRKRDGGRGEVDRDVALRDRGGEIVGYHHAVLEPRAALGVLLRLECGGEHERGLVRERCAHGAAHAAERADHEHTARSHGAHPISPSSLSTTWSRSRFGAVSGVSGSRISGPIAPESWSAALTGIGLVSTNSAENSGSRRRWQRRAAARSAPRNERTSETISAGATFAVVEITPLAPIASIGSVSASSPDSTLKLSGQRSITSEICPRSPHDSLIPTTCSRSESRATVEGSMLLAVRPGTL